MQLQCEQHDNYAQSCPYSWTSEPDGAVVANKNLNFPSRNETAPADLELQLGKWIEEQKEIKKTLPIDEVQGRIDRTIFVMFFGSGTFGMSQQ